MCNERTYCFPKETISIGGHGCVNYTRKDGHFINTGRLLHRKNHVNTVHVFAWGTEGLRGGGRRVPA